MTREESSAESDEARTKVLATLGRDEVSVGELVSKLRGSVKEQEVLSQLKSLEREKKVEMFEVAREGESVGSYAARSPNAAWFRALVIASLSALLMVYIAPVAPVLAPFRWLIGTAVPLFLPGFAVVQVLFPGREELDGIERLTISIVGSMVVATFLGLVLNESPWGITPSNAAIVVAAFCIVVGGAALYRQFALALARGRQK